MTNSPLDFDKTPAGQVLAWIDSLDPGTRTGVLCTLTFFGPVPWTAGLELPSLEAELPACWAPVRHRIQHEATESPFQNVGVALCLRALLSFYLPRLSSQTVESRTGVEREVFRLCGASPKILELLEEQLEDVPLQLARDRRTNHDWSRTVDAHLGDERLAQWLRSTQPLQPPG